MSSPGFARPSKRQASELDTIFSSNQIFYPEMYDDKQHTQTLFSKFQQMLRTEHCPPIPSPLCRSSDPSPKQLCQPGNPICWGNFLSNVGTSLKDISCCTATGVHAPGTPASCWDQSSRLCCRALLFPLFSPSTVFSYHNSLEIRVQTARGRAREKMRGRERKSSESARDNIPFYIACHCLSPLDSS